MDRQFKDDEEAEFSLFRGVEHGAKADLRSTTNIIMASWSRPMYHSVMSRAIRMLTSGLFGSHFFSASVTVS
ncbi:hypothetical protein KIN20_012792 [Parelaphostrongylus tenuis]|uniref:Uncharacterized protein n=1 Tax=Parelaphostrongylus tenuis TaxID=148309 RepID=A0AAD5MXE4_PARTN|nr:hypothetical protein KIN20_012792 [Parelaphostrongylus tenuis]